MDNVVTSVFAFEGDGVVKEYVGGYSDWVRQGGRFPPEASAQQEAEPEKNSSPVAEEKTPPKATTAVTESKPTKKLSYKLQRELDLLPAEIERLEAELEKLHDITGDSQFYQQDQDKVAKTLDHLQKTEAELETVMERWLELEAMQQG